MSVHDRRTSGETLNRLRWQCRRGMLELDHLLGHFLDLGYDDLDDAQQQCFLMLLGEQDQQLSDWFMSRSQPPDLKRHALVQRIIAVARERQNPGRC